MYPDDFSFNEPAPGGRYHIDLSTGNSDLRLSSDGADAIMQRWNADAGAFAARTEKYRLYE